MIRSVGVRHRVDLTIRSAAAGRPGVWSDDPISECGAPCRSDDPIGSAWSGLGPVGRSDRFEGEFARLRQSQDCAEHRRVGRPSPRPSL